MKNTTQLQFRIKEIKHRIERKNIIAVLENIPCITHFEFYEEEYGKEQFENMLHEIFKYKYPVYYHIAIEDILNSIDTFVKMLSLNDTLPTLIIPYFNETSIWVKIEVSNYKMFLSILFKKNVIFNDTIIDISNKIIYDVEIGENDYEVRIIHL